MNNNKFQTLLKVVLWLTPIIVGFALAIGAYREKQNALILKTDATNIRVSAVESLSSANMAAIAGLQKDVVYIREAISRIENKLNEKQR